MKAGRVNFPKLKTMSQHHTITSIHSAVPNNTLSQPQCSMVAPSLSQRLNTIKYQYISKYAAVYVEVHSISAVGTTHTTPGR